MTATLAVDRVSKDFSGLRALDGVTLTVAVGEIVGLIGPNGSGKTTLINVLTGLLPPTDGRVVVDGAEVTGLPAHAVARAGVARTFQTIRLFEGLSVLENVEVAAVSVGTPRRQARREATHLLEQLGMERWLDHSPAALPYGNERRLEIARALAMKPKFLLLDEPAAGLDERESAELVETLAPIPRERDLGMIVVDHDMHLIMRLCDRLHVLNYGKTIGEGTPAEVRRIPAVVEAYLGSTAADVDGEDRHAEG